MNTYKRHRFPHDIISYAVWLYFRFNLSYLDDEDLLAERGIEVSYETVRAWCHKFGRTYASRLRRRHGGFGDTFFLDEVFVKIRGKQHYLWRAVDQDGDVVDVLLQKRRNSVTAKKFFRRILRSSEASPRKMVTDKLGSYGAARRDMGGSWIHDTSQYSNNRAEQFHQPTGQRERGMRRFKSMGQAQRFVTAHAAVSNLFNLGRHLVRAQHYRDLRNSAFSEWIRAVA